MKKIITRTIDLYKSIYKAKSFLATNLWHRQSVDDRCDGLSLQSTLKLWDTEKQRNYFFTLSLVQKTIVCSKIGIASSSTLQCQFFRVTQMWQVVKKWINGEQHKGTGMVRSEVSFKSGNKNLLSVSRKMSLTVAFLVIPIACPKSSVSLVL